MYWLFVLELLEVPLSWEKVKGGLKVEWIGYTLDADRFERGISERKVKWVSDWMDTHVKAGEVTGRGLRSALGRLVFVAGALHHVRPFLGPIFAWAAVLRGGTFANMPDAVCLLLEYIKKQFGVCLWLQRETAEAFRIDAMAEGEKILIGGWETGAEADMAKARWFSVTLDRRLAA